METLVGFAVGYLVGTRQGKQGLAKVRESWTAIRESADIKALIGEFVAAAGPAMRDLARATGGGG